MAASDGGKAMNGSRYTVNLRWPLAVVAVIGLLAAGAGLAWLFGRGREEKPVSLVATPMQVPPSTVDTQQSASAPVAVTISQDVAARAGIEVAPVSTTAEAGTVIVPAVVEPHGYKQVPVTPLAAGRITRVLVELGQQVTRRQTMAEIYSPELATAQTQYLSAHASLEAARQRLKRTDRLVEI